MEYSFLKELEPSLGFMFEQSTHPILTPYPKLDFVNPGLGQCVRIHNFMVPLHANDTLHLIEKKVDNEINEQFGSGENDKEIDNEKELIQNQIQQLPNELNEKKRKLLGDGIQSSFLNPKKIKINKLILQGKGHESEISEPNEQTKTNPKLKHKFQFE